MIFLTLSVVLADSGVLVFQDSRAIQVSTLVTMASLAKFSKDHDDINEVMSMVYNAIGADKSDSAARQIDVLRQTLITMHDTFKAGVKNG